MLVRGEPVVIIIEGQIGVGKTTMGVVLERELDITLYRELQRPETHSLLDRFYADQGRWAFTLQIHFLNERFRMIKQIRDAGGGALDRSIYGDRIFADVLHEDGQMNEEEYVTYTTLLDNMLEHVQPPDLLVYLDCTVDTALNRIKKRDRGLESTIPRDYLERLNKRYLRFYDAYEASPKMLIDTDARPIDVRANVPPILDEIRAALEGT
ncbi:MAG: deoxynucleoside kinase [Spirochaetales bacterium]|nr:deoxynucleoside kinase [Spirochaetales bacterium]